MWKIVLAALIVIFLIADAIYLYYRLKEYWRRSSWNRRGAHNKKWRIGLSSLDLPIAGSRKIDPPAQEPPR